LDCLCRVARYQGPLHGLGEGLVKHHMDFMTVDALSPVSSRSR
jgi:hypothetical protein